jgi:hypothetical protein
MFTENGHGVSSRQRRISARNSSAVRLIEPTVPSAPALLTAAASSAPASRAIPAWMMGWETPNLAVNGVLINITTSAPAGVPRTVASYGDGVRPRRHSPGPSHHSLSRANYPNVKYT